MAKESIRLLILDDDPEDVELLEDLLRDAPTLGVEVAAEHTTRGALERLDEGTVDVLLVDYRLGAESGADFIRHPLVVRSRIPAILMTGVGTPEVDREALEAGAVDYLPKDELTAEHLSRSLRYAVERRRRQHVEARLEALIGNARELVSIIAPDGTIAYVSPSLKRVLGFDPDDKTDVEALEEVHPDDREKADQALRRAFEDGGPVELVYRVQDAEGRWRWLDTTAESHVHDPDIGGVVVSSWDVTDRVLAQQNVRFQAELLDAVGQAVIATDIDGEVLYWNPAAEHLYGWTQEEALGSDIMDLTVHGPRHAQATEIMETLQRGETWHGEFEVSRKNGSTFTALVANSPIVDVGGRLVGIIGASSDITDIKRTEHDLTERIKELRTLNQASMLLNRSDLSMDERLRRLVESLPRGWLHPEHTEARLTLPGRTMATEGFRETRWMQSVDVSTDDGEGRLEIALTGGIPDDSSDPFLGEEYELLDSVGSMIQQTLERSSLTTLLTQAFASLQEAVFVIGTGRVIQYANPVAEEMFGYPLDELLGTSTQKLHVDPDAFRRFALEGEARLEEDGVFSADYPMRRSDGEIFAAEQTISLLDRSRGLEGGAVSVVRDISEQRAAEAELIESERRFREITEAIDDVFWVTTPGEEGVEYLSPAFEEIWGRPVTAAYDDPGAWLETVVPEDRDRARRFVDRQPVAPQKEEYRIRKPDGEERYILDRSFPVRGADGTLERIIGVARDITGERRIEERFGLLSQEISDVIYVLAPDGTVLTSSPSVLEATGYTRQEFEGSDAVDMVHPDDREDVRSALASVAAQPDRVARAEYRIVTKSGDTIQVESVARNLVDNPAVGGLLITSRDVTERHELERRVRQMQKMESVGRLAGGVAHDFNNILTVIRSQADLILMEKPEKSVADDVTVIQDAADRAARLTKQLLAFSREQVLQPRNVDLGDVVRGTSDLIQRLIGEQIRVRYQVATDLATVRMDPNHMEQVLVNLAVNARDAMSGGGELVISVQEQTLATEEAESVPDLDPGHYVVVRVRDTGVGMTSDTLQRIFEPFFTTKAKGEGTGLGLSMVYGTVRQSGGSVQVDSVPGRGTTFHLFFPAIDGEKDEDVESRKETAAARKVSGSVLVVEDDPQVRSAARRVLESAGFRVTEAGSAEAAMAHLTGGGVPDVILTDLVLEGMRGYDLMERAAESWPDIPLVVMSGYAHGSPGRKGLPADVPFVQKPFTPSGLVSTIREALGRRAEEG